MKVKFRINSLYIVFLLLIEIVLLECNADKLQCRDEKNRPIDWYVLYKIPKISQSSNPLIRQGLAYLYITSDAANTTGWTLSERKISAKDSIIGNTLAPLYKDSEASKLLWILYNDDPPNQAASAKYGHAKGVAIFGVDRGFWLVHSVPKFPPVPRTGDVGRRRNSSQSVSPGLNGTSSNDYPFNDGEYDYPKSGENNGQSFLCVSLKDNQFDVVGKQLIFNQIIVYKRNLPESLSNRFPVFTDAANQVRLKNPPYYNEEKIVSLGELNFTSFAKSDKWQKDLYDDFVAPRLHSDMYTETWLNGRGRLPSDCTGSKVLNVRSIVLSAANVNFKSSVDHSKWAVAIDNKKNRNWICIGDINRAETQYHRGGGTVCLNLRAVWKNYRESVNDVEACPRPTRP